MRLERTAMDSSNQVDSNGFKWHGHVCHQLKTHHKRSQQPLAAVAESVELMWQLPERSFSNFQHQHGVSAPDHPNETPRHVHGIERSFACRGAVAHGLIGLGLATRHKKRLF